MRPKYFRKAVYLFFVLLAAGLALYQYKRSEKEFADKKQENLAFPPLQLEQVQNIKIKNPEAEVELNLKEDGSWHLKRPFLDQADSSKVNSWLESLLSKNIESIGEENPDWIEYGLSENKKHLILTDKKNTAFKMEFSAFSAFDGRIFIKKENRLFLGDVSWPSLTEKDVGYFRSYHLLNREEHPQSLGYRSRTSQIQLKWENYKWLWSSKNKYPLDHQSVESYWTSLANILLEKNIKKQPKQTSSRFKNPVLQIDLNFKDGNSWQARFFKGEKDNYNVLISDRNYLFSINKEQWEKLIKPEQSFRDHKAPFQFAKDKVYFISLKGNSLNLEIKKEGTTWVLDSKEDIGQNSALDAEELDNVLNRVQALSAKKYFGNKKTDKKDYLILKDSEKQPLLTLDFGTSFTQEDKKYIFTASSLGQEAMAVLFKDFENIFSKKLLKKEAEADSKENRQKPGQD